MLSEERYSAIINLLEQKKAITVTELTKALNASESTIRRDLNTLAQMGKLNKVHGGATLLGNDFDTYEDDVATKELLCVREKSEIGKYASSLITDNDFVYIDAGTTTSSMIDFIDNSKATYVTNGITHARKLLSRGLNVYVVGGKLKKSTEAVIGAEGVSSMKKYNFTKAFLGTNGISKTTGFTTPDMEEAVMKIEAVRKSIARFILADHTKFEKVFAVTFCDIENACIITDLLRDDKYSEIAVVKEVLR